MPTKIEKFESAYLKKDLPDLRSGDKVRIFQRIKESVAKGKSGTEIKEKSQVFEGTVIAKKHGKSVNALLIVRSIIEGVGVEKSFPVHLPLIEKIELLERKKTKRGKLYYLREKTEKDIRRKLK